MSQYCTKCGTENEDGAKFCKSCGAGLVAAQAPLGKIDEQNVKSTETKNIAQTVIKVVVWIVVTIVAMMIAVFGYFLIKTSSLKSGCENNNAQACYDLSVFDNPFASNSERSTARGKACDLGNANACMEDYSYQKACDLKNGEGCFMVTGQNYELYENKTSIRCIKNLVTDDYLFEKNRAYCDNSLAELNRENALLYNLGCGYGHKPACI